MSYCPICNLEITSKNANLHLPFTNNGNLKDGKRICSKCYLKLQELDNSIFSNLKEYDTNQIMNVFAKNTSKENDINQQLLNIGINKNSSIYGRKELKELPNILNSNEQIKGITIGLYNGGSGILVATDRRLIFIDKGLFYGLKTEDFGLDKISSIQFESGILMATIKIMASGNLAKIEHVDKVLGKSFCEMVRNLLSEPKANQVQNTNVSKDDLIEKLERLGKLKADGILTQEEFDMQKSKLLNM